ncbi:copper resistance protein B [Sphingomonas sanguinis]|uniref:copper resistance protein B n=1 Tax=Sphingomonas sp. LC-1 TaxID=3110957 RepID=UPI0021BA5A8E|nr:copper resistance protein B [Sphingomonas sp. LC-1]MCT8003667.1 copper resistance protein B [Sphingomonas sp. LC-1]
MIALMLMLADPTMQHQGMAMPGMTMPMAKPKPVATPKPWRGGSPTPAKRGKPGGVRPARTESCSAEHAAMGHCRPTAATPTGEHDDMAHGAMPPMTMPSPAPACSAEHAAMGHCRPGVDAAGGMSGQDHGAMPGMAPAAAPACPPEHAAMGHCQPGADAAGGMSGQDHGAMPGMAPAAAPACPPEHAAMGHCQPGAAMGIEIVMDHGAMPGMTDAQQAIGHAPPPAPPGDRAADRFYDPATMAAADRQMRMEHGGMRFSQILFNLAEVQWRDGRDGYRWDGEGWFGGDVDRLVVKTEGEGTLGGRIGAAEVQGLYSRAIDPYWNVQAGVRQDVGVGARRTYAVLGVEGLAPYWFDVEATLFLSDKGELHGRAEAWIDQRITQRAILQPRAEVNLAAQDVPEQRITAGVSSLELGLRLRYEVAREFAPYVGVNWERRYGAGGGGGAALVLGVRSWF